MGMLGLLVPGVGMGGGTAVPSATGPVTPIVRVPTTDDVIWRPVAEPVTGTLDTRIQNYIEDRIVENPAGDYMPYYTDYEHDPGDLWPGGTFTKNSACWAAGLDMSGVGTRVQGQYWFKCTLLSRDHALTANHTVSGGEVGRTYYFIKDDGTVEEAVVADYQRFITSDITILYFTASVSTDLKVYSVLPENYTDYLVYDPTDLEVEPLFDDPLNGKPLLFLDDDNRVSISTISNMSPEAGATLTHTNVVHKYPNRGDYYEFPVTGDSSNPLFLLLNGDLVVVGSHFGATYFHFITRFIDELNEIMTDLDTRSNGYQLTIKSLLTPTVATTVRRVRPSSSDVIRRV